MLGYMLRSAERDKHEKLLTSKEAGWSEADTRRVRIEAWKVGISWLSAEGALFAQMGSARLR